MSSNAKSAGVILDAPEVNASFLDAVAEPIMVVRKEDRVIVYVNPPAERLFHQQAQDMVGRKCHCFICPNDFGQCPILDLGKDVDHSGREIIVDGKRRPAIKTVRPIGGQEGDYLLETFHPLAWDGQPLFDRDLIASIEESQNRYKSLFSDNHTPMLIIDPESGKIMDANKAAAHFYGYGQEEFSGLRISDINQLSEEQVFQEMARAREEKRNHFIFQHCLANGEIRTVEVYSGPIPLGGKTLLYSMVHDVTDLVTTEKLLAERTEQLEQLFANAPIAINFCAVDGTLLRVNAASVEMFGYDHQDEMVGKCIDEMILPPEKRAEGQAITRNMMLRSEPLSFEGTRYRKDGTAVEVSFIGFPFKVGAQEGAFAIYQDISSRRRAEKDLEVSNRALRDQYAALKHSWNQTIEVMAYAAELRDPYTAGHQKRVSALSGQIARELGLPQVLVEEVEKAALVHDLGKFEIPSEILSKPGKISPLELNLIRRHAEAGYNILKKIDLPWPLADIVYQHHERMDGSGYPQGLKGREILIQARIIAVADVMEAMSSHRPYRPALGLEKALGELEKGSGTLYDPAVADACCSLFRDKGFSFLQD